MLVADNISFAISKKPILSEVSLSLRAGTILSILGPNGAGKSTLLKCLAGFYKVTQGAVSIDGQPYSAFTLKELALRRAVLSQKISIDFPFTVFEVASMGRNSGGSEGLNTRDREILHEVLTLVSMDRMEGRIFSTLSGGEQQRVHFARVLAQVWDRENALLLLDEPTAALDLKHQFMVFDICRDLCSTKNFSVVTVLHDLRMAKAVSDQAIFLQNGTVFERGPSENTIRRDVISSLYELSQEQVFL